MRQNFWNSMRFFAFLVKNIAYEIDSSPHLILVMTSGGELIKSERRYRTERLYVLETEQRSKIKYCAFERINRRMVETGEY